MPPMAEMTSDTKRLIDAHSYEKHIEQLWAHTQKRDQASMAKGSHDQGSRSGGQIHLGGEGPSQRGAAARRPEQGQRCLAPHARAIFPSVERRRSQDLLRLARGRFQRAPRMRVFPAAGPARLPALREVPPSVGLRENNLSPQFAWLTVHVLPPGRPEWAATLHALSPWFGGCNWAHGERWWSLSGPCGLRL